MTLTHWRSVAGAVLAGILLLASWSTIWAEEVITFVRPDGGVSVVIPAPTCLQELQRAIGTPTGPGECPALGLTPRQAVEWVRDKDVPPPATGVTIQNRTTLPNSRRFRDAWRSQGGVVSVEMTEARKIRQTELEREIDKKIQDSTATGVSAGDAGNAAKDAAHKTYRQSLRALKAGLPASLAAIPDPEGLAQWAPTYSVQP